MNDITPQQALIIWCLLGKQGQALQSEIVPEVKKKDREALEASGLISSEKPQRAFVLKVEDKGWYWAGQHLRDELPPKYQVLQNWLRMVHHNLENTDQTLADFISSAPALEPGLIEKKATISSQKKRSTKAKKGKSQPKSKKKASKKTKKPSNTKPTEIPKSLTQQQFRVSIERAYLAITGGRKAKAVPLSKIRAQLSELDRATVDAGLLRILQGDSKARLGQVSDPKMLTQADREAAFNPGGEPFHLLWIES
ncbi:MAG: hypothetical protein K8F62_02480 [Pseudorhodoplanes sp.]|nr:hypothetical protein [Pseudorhodoplanes sp.]